jgi:hypothetical protein
VKRFLIAIAWAIGGYLVGAFGGGFLINVLSSNQFDRSMEAAMTGAFVTGPLAGVIAFIVGFVRSGRAGPPAM